MKDIASAMLMRCTLIVVFTLPLALAVRVAEAGDKSQPTKLPAAQGDSPIDFKRDIRPILRNRCYHCHGPQKKEGGLRLDDRQHAVTGGTSQQSVLGGTLETNQIYQRITSTNLEERMPLMEAPLPPAEIAVIAKWVQRGTPWPASSVPLPTKTPTRIKPEPEPGFFGWLGQLWDEIAMAQSDYAYLKRLGIVAFGCLLGALVVEVCREARKKEKPWTRGKLRFLVSAVTWLRLSYFVIAILVVTIFLGWRDFHTKVTTLRDERDKLRSSLISATSGEPVNADIYGSPPIPNRPHKQKEISGTYYRGNCERNAKLFNGGNYRTATFHLSVVDADQKEIKLGEPIKDGTLSIRFEIERAPKTADAFFTKKTTDRIFLAENHVKFPVKSPTSDPVPLQTLVEGQRWGASYPIGAVPGDERTTKSGLIYVVVGIEKEKAAMGQIHYGIKYDLIFENHKIVEGSDVWMSELYITPPIAPPRTDKIPIDEWFDYRPIPEITGDNTTDPKLLGIDTLSGGPDDPLSKKDAAKEAGKK